MQNQDKNFWHKLKEVLLKFAPYFVNYFAGVGVGLLISVVCNIPLRFIKIINIDLALFIVGFVGMGVTLFRRSWALSYSANSYTYTFKLKTTLLLVGMVLGVQILLSLLIGHTVYISGPTHWLAFYVLSAINPTLVNAKTMLLNIDWALLLVADICIYAPIMILGEYLGAKQHNK